RPPGPMSTKRNATVVRASRTGPQTSTGAAHLLSGHDDEGEPRRSTRRTWVGRPIALGGYELELPNHDLDHLAVGDARRRAKAATAERRDRKHQGFFPACVAYRSGRKWGRFPTSWTLCRCQASSFVASTYLRASCVTVCNRGAVLPMVIVTLYRMPSGRSSKSSSIDVMICPSR